jgi:hypothetical protein
MLLPRGRQDRSGYRSEGVSSGREDFERIRCTAGRLATGDEYASVLQ